MTGSFLLDASMTLSWAFEGESTPYTVAVLKSLETVQAIVPALWPFEVSTAERRGRMEAAAQAAFLERLRLLPIDIEHRPATWLAQQIPPLVRAHKISAYDAACLELAVRKGLRLATLDDDLRRGLRGRSAAGRLGVSQAKPP